MSTDTVVRVERGNAGPEELAAITAILLARAAGGRPATSSTQRRSLARWRRLERQSGFRAPHSWQG
jgi:Acyl-CoA carboxylase epsilon subunit